MTIVSIIGTRPQLVKVAELCRAIKQDKQIKHKILHTGQHYDECMSQQHINDLSIPAPDRNLGINQGTSIENTALMMMGIERTLIEWKPDLVIVYGDTDSTLAGALTSMKLHIKLAHYEAGARSNNIQMQEEVNRITVDSVADLLLFASKCNGHGMNLKPWQTGIFVGDLMLDSLIRHKYDYTWKEGEQFQIKDNYKPVKKREYYYMTLHRPETIDSKENLLTVLSAVGNHLDYPVYLAVHPRLRANLERFKVNIPPGIICIDPQRYTIGLKLMAGARKVLTDSGGMQKESFWLKTPCVTLRDQTEWPETLNFDRNILTGIDRERIRQAIKVHQALNPSQDPHLLFGSGLAGITVLNAVKTFIKAVSG